MEQYIHALSGIYQIYNREAAKAVLLTNYDGSKPFSFADYPETKRAIQKIQSNFAQDIGAVVMNGINAEWENSNLFNDNLTKQLLKKYGAIPTDEAYRRYFRHNDQAKAAFLKRKTNGLTLSDRIWDISDNYKQGLETAISTSIEKGYSAITLSKKISQYLQDFDKLRADYSEKFGSAAHILDCEYRSARLARTEINMAYRAAENERWAQLDFVVGFEVKRSGVGFDCPLCESLAGKYPKDFLFTGWHPNCRCYQISILNTEEEFWNESETSVNEVTDVPDGFKQWVADNQERIAEAEQRGTLPYFLRENREYMNENLPVNVLMERAKLSHNEIADISNGTAQMFGGYSTPVNLESKESILRKANADYEGNVWKVLDSVRTTLILPENQIEKCIAFLEREHNLFRDTKRQLPQHFMGYSGNIVNIRLKNGLIGEIQINTEKMIFAKNSKSTAIKILGENRWNEIYREVGVEGGLGHKFYEQWRILHPKSKEAKEIAEKSFAYYALFR